MSFKEIEEFPEPLIGLQHIKELQDAESRTFCCDLCDITCGSSIIDIIHHASSKHHRTNYMRRHYKSYLDSILVAAFPEQSSLIVEFSKRVEKIEGRKPVGFSPCNSSTSSQLVENRISMLDEDLRTAPMEAASSSTNTAIMVQPEDSRISDFSCVGPVLHKMALQSGHKSIRDMLGNFTENMINNEQEAAKTFEVANILSKTLLEYRLKTAP